MSTSTDQSFEEVIRETEEAVRNIRRELETDGFLVFRGREQTTRSTVGNERPTPYEPAASRPGPAAEYVPTPLEILARKPTRPGLTVAPARPPVLQAPAPPRRPPPPPPPPPKPRVKTVRQLQRRIKLIDAVPHKPSPTPRAVPPTRRSLPKGPGQGTSDEGIRVPMDTLRAKLEERRKTKEEAMRRADQPAAATTRTTSAQVCATAAPVPVSGPTHVDYVVGPSRDVNLLPRREVTLPNGMQVSVPIGVGRYRVRVGTEHWTLYLWPTTGELKKAIQKRNVSMR